MSKHQTGVILLAAALLPSACGSDGDVKTGAEIRLTSKPARIETFRPAEFEFAVAESGESVDGHAMSVTVERSDDGSPSMGSGTDADRSASPSSGSRMGTTHMGGDAYRAEMTFLQEGHYRMEAMTSHEGVNLSAMFEMDVETSRRTSGGYGVTFAAWPVMSPGNGDMHVGEEAVFEFGVTRSDGAAARGLSATVAFVSPEGVADPPLKTEDKGNGRYQVRRSFANARDGTWNARFSAVAGDESIEAEFGFPVSDHGDHTDRLPVMEMHSSSMMGMMGGVHRDSER